ncbi:hypothetical protein RJ640_014549 [Escallonia rubra]|uniref:RNA cytidine acetyltransferase n=1 Tax=Escallonia rubra TaxID=112253 RepID=A0AA88RDW6_9ASTE|nr:hypothetical protein RJ640_014549 [Escallonia rubra]
MRKKVDERIRTLIENGVKTKHRSMFVVIGDKSRDQALLSPNFTGTRTRTFMLWWLSSIHKKKRAKQVKKLMQRGLLDPEKDFEALTPNLLARTVETVEGGGLIVLLLRSLSSLTSLCTMVMDVHERFRTESHTNATGRFNERFLLSLGSCKSCVVMDDELNILPLSSHMKLISPVAVKEDSEGLSEAERDLKNLKEQLNDDFPVGPLIKKCSTLDQGKAVITFLDAILDKTLRSTVALLAARGRGKSASLGLAIAGAVASGYSNIFVTAPSPENLKTLFEFVCKGFHMLEYKVALVAGHPWQLAGQLAGLGPHLQSNSWRPSEWNDQCHHDECNHQLAHQGWGSVPTLDLAEILVYHHSEEHLDYDVVKSPNPEFKKATVRINIYKQHRQTIQGLLCEGDDLSVYILDITLECIAGFCTLVRCGDQITSMYRSRIHLLMSSLVIDGTKDSKLWNRPCENLIPMSGMVVVGRVSGIKQSVTRVISTQVSNTQYIQPHEHGKLSQVELLVVDEAAAIPLPVVKSLLGPYLVFLSSTVNGYEGTGRSLSLKLLQQLEEQSRMSTKSMESGQLFKKIELSEAIRYASGDPIETWLHALLCLDVTNSIPNISRLPSPRECDLYYVNRDTLFSYHKDSELFLQRMMALYVASHYKNSPNDLQLMADAPAHHLFVLLGPVDQSKNHLPDILCVVQVCLEGQISSNSAIRSLREGHQPSGDQIPWKFCQQFRDTGFPSLSGARIVRIATHPSAMRLGYGSTAVELLTSYLVVDPGKGHNSQQKALEINWYFEGQFTSISEVDAGDVSEPPSMTVTVAAEKVSLLEENIKPRTNLPPLLVPLSERQPEKLHYIGVSFGLTLDLFRFWRKHKFAPFYIGHIPSTVTGEHACMVLKPLNNDEIEANEVDEWGFFSPFYQDFREKFVTELGSSSFSMMEYKLAMSILDPKINFADTKLDLSTSKELLSAFKLLAPFNMKRLEAYTNNLADFHSIFNLVPSLAQLYFWEKLPVTLSYAQASVLLCMGLQNRDVSYLEGMMKLERQQILSLFIKVMKKFHKYLNDVASKEIDSALPPYKEIVMKPHAISVDEDLDDAAKKVKAEMNAKMDGMLDPVLLQQYAIVDREADFESALQNGGGKIHSGGLVSVKSSSTKLEKHGKQEGSHKSGKKRDNKARDSKSNKRRKP